MDAAVERGVEALERNRLDRAEASLQSVVRADPGYVARKYGTAGYWLGRVYLHQERRDHALLTWSETLGALQEAGRFDATLADAFVREVHRERSRAFYPLAAVVYEQLLRQARHGLTGTTWDVLEDDLQAVALLVPDSLRQRLGLPLPGERLRPEALAAEAGSRLTTWWRSQDPLPATPSNERLHEHLVRLVYAMEHYAPDGHLDDRGQVYVRLGEPFKQTHVTFESPEFRRKVLDRSRTLHRTEFRPAEFWVYRQVADATHYLFIRRDDGNYRIGHPDEVVPRSLRLGHGPGERGYRKASAYIWSMEEVYRQLAVLHGDYNQRYADIADHATILNHQEIAGGRAVSIGDLPPHTFASSFSRRAEFEDEQLDDRREEETPAIYTSVFDETLPMPVVTRTARFLDPDGTTRTELYWSAPIEVAEPLEGRTQRDLNLPTVAGQTHYLVDVTLVQFDEAHRRQRVQEAERTIDVRDAEGRAMLVPQSVAIHGATGRYQLAAQWDQYAAVTDEGTGHPVPRLPRVRLHSWRSEPIQALDADPATLEMSDLKPVRMPESGPVGPEAIDSLGTPYPYLQLESDAELALYFEIYHLAYGADDRSHYTITYEVEQKDRDVPALLRLWQEPDRPTRTAATTSFSGTGRTAREMILMDLEEVREDGVVTVNVRVADETTGQTAARAITFELEQ